MDRAAAMVSAACDRCGKVFCRTADTLVYALPYENARDRCLDKLRELVPSLSGDVVFRMSVTGGTELLQDMLDYVVLKRALELRPSPSMAAVAEELERRLTGALK